MLKKILYFGIAIVLGIVALYGTYYSSYINHVQGLITTAINEERYEDAARVFTPFIDPTNLVDVSKETDKCLTYVYASGVVNTAYKSNEEAVSVYTSAYSFYFFDLKNIDFDGITSNEVLTNYSGVVFKNSEASKEYFYPFVAPTYNLTQAITSINCVEIDLTNETITEKLDGKITSFEFINGKNTSVFEKACDLSFTEEFYDEVNPFFNKYKEYAILEEITSEEMDTYYDEWILSYSYLLGYNSKDLQPSSLIWSTVGVMAIYVVCVGALGFFIFRKKRPTPIHNSQMRNKEKVIDADVKDKDTLKEINRIENQQTDATDAEVVSKE